MGVFVTLLLPEGVDREAWDGYEDMRQVMWKSKKVPWTERAKNIALKQLSEWHAQGYDVNYVLDEAVLKGWRGLFVSDRTPKLVRQIERPAEKELTRASVLMQIIDQRNAARFRKDKMWEMACSAALGELNCLGKAS